MWYLISKMYRGMHSKVHEEAGIRAQTKPMRGVSGGVMRGDPGAGMKMTCQNMRMTCQTMRTIKHLLLQYEMASWTVRGQV